MSSDGRIIGVQVESVFEEGMVVTYTDPATGAEFRGAMLANTDQR